MKRSLLILVAGVFALGLSTTASAQLRGISGGALVLDDYHGNSMTLTTPPYGSPEWEAWALEGFPNTWYSPVPPQNGAQDAFIYSGPIPTYGTGSINPPLIAYWVPPGITGINNVGGAAGAWDYATAGQLGIGGAGDNLAQYVIPMSDGAGDWVASSLTDNGSVQTPEDFYANSLNLPNSYSLYTPGIDNLTLGSIDNTFNLVLNTDNDAPGAGQFNVYLDGNGTAAMSVTTAQTTISSLGTGVVHSDAFGDLSSSLIVNGDITNGTIANNKLANSSLTVTAGTGLSGGGVVALGGSTTLNISPSYAGQTSITTLGTITTGTWHGTPIANAYLANSSLTVGTAVGSGFSGGGLVSLGGSLALSIPAGGVTNAMLANNSLTVTAGTGLSGGGVVALGGSTTLNIAPGYAGQTSISTLGTITTGTWDATPIANSELANSSLTIGTAAGSGLSGGGLVSLGGSLALSIPAGGVTNAMLANNSITVTAGTGLSGGGLVALGGSTTLTNAGVTSIAGTANQITASAATGAVTLSLPATINVNTSGNAATVTNGVYTTGSYSDPTWITSISGSIVSGTVASATTATNANNVATTAVTTNATFYPLFVASSANGNQAVDLDASGYGYNPSTNTLTLGAAGTATGNLSLGNGTGANYTTIQAGASAPAVTYILPTALPGAANDVLQANGTTSPVQLSWVAPSGGGGSPLYSQTSSVNTAAYNYTTTAHMAGVGATFKPNSTGHMLLTITGDLTCTESSSGPSITGQAYYGTGTAPAQGATVSGTAIGSLCVVSPIGGGHSEEAPFTVSYYGTFTVGTTYWVDLACTVTNASTGTVNNVELTAIELP